jgi:multidrug efflux pump subunit AcrA (membrane-fusion protein)
VDTYVPQSVVTQVRQRKQAAVYFGERRIPASKVTIFPQAASPSSTFRARLDLPPGSNDLAPGTYVKVGLVVGEVERLTVPASALVRRSEVTAVYVVDDKGAVTLRYVRPGDRFGDDVEILAGLKPGDRVALDPVAASARPSGARS